MTNKGRGHSTLFVNKVCSVPLLTPVAQLAQVCISKGIAIASIADQLGVTRATVYNWFTGKVEPRPRTLVSIEQVAARLAARK